MHLLCSVTLFGYTIWSATQQTLHHTHVTQREEKTTTEIAFKKAKRELHRQCAYIFSSTILMLSLNVCSLSLHSEKQFKWSFHTNKYQIQ